MAEWDADAANSRRETGDFVTIRHDHQAVMNEIVGWGWESRRGGEGREGETEGGET